MGQCDIDRPVTIYPESEIDFTIDVGGLDFTDLATDQSVCAVFIEMEHGRLENIRVRLVSPAGQEVTLIGPGITGGGLTPAVNWNVSFVPCGFVPSPDAGFDPIWRNDQPWSAFVSYTGSYHPNSGCLEDFNMGSAEGPWQVVIDNLGTTEGVLIYFRIQFCDGTSVDCEVCSLNAGTWLNDDLIFCAGDPALDIGAETFLFDPDYDTNTQTLTYHLIQSDQVIASSDDLADLSGFLDSGNYEICGLVYNDALRPMVDNATEIQDLLTLDDDPSFCLDLMEDCLQISLLPSAQQSQIDTFYCVGDTLRFLGEEWSEAIDTILFIGNNVNPCAEEWVVSVESRSAQAILEGPAQPLVCGEIGILDGSDSESVGSGSITYEWATTDGNFVTDFGPIAQVDAAGEYELIYSSGDCVDTARLTIETVDTFGLEFVVEEALCTDQDSFMIEIQDTFGLSALPYTIELIEGPTDAMWTIEDDRITVDSEGTYFITTSIGNCKRTDRVVVVNRVMPLFLLLEAPDTLTCEVDSVRLILYAAAPSGIDTILGIGQDTFDANVVDLFVSEPGLYTVILRDDLGCELVDSIEIIADDERPSVSIDDLTIDCDEVSVDGEAILSNNVDSVAWSGPNAFFSDDLLPSLNDTGRYTLTVFDENLCSAETQFDVSQAEIMTFELNLMMEACGDAQLLVDGMLSELDRIELNGEIVPISDMIALDSGQNEIVLFDGNDCSQDTTIVITTQGISINLGPDITLIEGEDQQIMAIPSADATDWIINWSQPEILSCSDCLDPIAQPVEDAELIIIVSDANGCTATDTLNLLVIRDNEVIDTTNIYFPTVFQPTLPRPNGIYTVGIGPGDIEQMSFYVYDRWGNLIHRSVIIEPSSEVEIWDGRIGSEDAMPGVYLYMAELLHTNDRTSIQSGQFSLIR